MCIRDSLFCVQCTRSARRSALSFAACGEGVLSENGYGYRKAFGGAADYEQGGNLLLVYPKRRNQCAGLYLSYGRGIFAGISCESVHFFVIIIQNRYTYDADSTKFTEKWIKSTEIWKNCTFFKFFTYSLVICVKILINDKRLHICVKAVSYTHLDGHCGK